MKKIKNTLLETIRQDDIDSLTQYTSGNYRDYDPGKYLYNLIMDFPQNRKFTNEFIELSYTTLIAWNMNSRAARLSDFPLFKDSLIRCRHTIQSLNSYRLEKLKSIEPIAGRIT